MKAKEMYRKRLLIVFVAAVIVFLALSAVDDHGEGEGTVEIREEDIIPEGAGAAEVSGKRVKKVSAYGVSVKLPVAVRKSESVSSGIVSWTSYSDKRSENCILIQKYEGETDAEKALRKTVAPDGDIVKYISDIKDVTFRNGEKGFGALYRFGDECFTVYSFSCKGDSFVVDYNTKGDLGELKDCIAF